MTHQNIRLDRVNQLIFTIKTAMKEGHQIDEDKLIAAATLEWGASRRIVLEYLKQLETIGRIIRVGGKVWTPKHYEADLILRKADDKGI